MKTQWGRTRKQFARGDSQEAAIPHAQYCLPTDSPDLAKEGRLKAGMLSPLVWAQHRPDRFDSYSAGAALLPSLP